MDDRPQFDRMTFVKEFYNSVGKDIVEAWNNGSEAGHEEGVKHGVEGERLRVLKILELWVQDMSFYGPPPTSLGYRFVPLERVIDLIDHIRSGESTRLIV